MGKFSSSSAQSRPLFFLSLVVSLALHAGGIYFLLRHPPSFLIAREIPTVEHLFEQEAMVDQSTHEAFQNLIVREDQNENLAPPGSIPKLESVKTPFIVTNQDAPLFNYGGESLGPELNIGSYVPMLVQDPWITSKKSPFLDKKTISFNREIAKDSTSDLSPELFVAQKDEDISRTPLVEAKEKKKSFLHEDFSVRGQEEGIPSTPPLAFDHPSESSELIDRNLHLKKSEMTAFPSLDHPKVVLQNAKPTEGKQKKEARIDPKVEPHNKPSFGPDQYFYYIDYISDTPVYPFQMEETFEDVYMPFPYFHEKLAIAVNPDFAESTFNALAWADFSHFCEDKIAIEWMPTQEKSELQLPLHFTVPEVEISSSSNPAKFEENPLDLSVAQRKPYCADKFFPSENVLAQTTFEPNPYLDVWDSGIEAQRTTYSPEREGIVPDPNRYSLPSGPTVAPEVGQNLYCFTLTTKFDLFISENGICPPKKLQNFVASRLEIDHSYFSNNSFENLASSPLSPQLETSSPPLFTEETLALRSPIEPPSSPTIDFPRGKGGDSLPMIDGEVNFPEGKAPPSRIQLEPPTQSYLSAPPPQETSLDTQEPILEEPLSTISEKTVALESQGVQQTIPEEFKIDQSFALNLQQEKPLFEKQIEKESTLVDLQQLTLPNVKEKQISSQSHLAQENPLLDQFPNLNSRIAAAPKLSPAKEMEAPLPTKDTIHEPIRPSYYPPEVPHLEMAANAASISMLEENLEYVKKQTAPNQGEVLNDLSLPYVSTKRIDPSKHVTMPQTALEAIPAPQVIIDITGRDTQFPNTRELLEKGSAPSRIHADVAITAAAMEEPDTDMIHSQAKEILEDYNQENSASSGLLALARPKVDIGVKEDDVRSLNQSSRFTQAFLTEIPPPSYLETATYAEEFETKVHYSKREDGKGYLFALKMKPKPSLHFASPHQNIIFVIDGSSSIKRHRFSTFKEGVSRSLGYMKDGDSFNVIVADAELVPFNKTSVAWNRGNTARAKRFLGERKYRGFFINYDPFDLLASVTKYFDPERENVVILISDGHSFQNFKSHKEDFQELAEASKGHFSIYTATASQNNNLTMLDLLSTFNDGELMYSKTHAAFSRQLAVMVKHIENLVAKNVHVHVTDRKIETGIEFYPNQNTLPSLFSDRPYTIYGTIDELKDFDLILQGRSGNEWINVKQHISFKHAEKASYAIKRGFALQKAYVCYDYYLKNEDPFFLNEAERILNPHAIPTATQ